MGLSMHINAHPVRGADVLVVMVYLYIPSLRGRRLPVRSNPLHDI